MVRRGVGSRLKSLRLIISLIQFNAILLVSILDKSPGGFALSAVSGDTAGDKALKGPVSLRRQLCPGPDELEFMLMPTFPSSWTYYYWTG